MTRRLVSLLIGWILVGLLAGCGDPPVFAASPISWNQLLESAERWMHLSDSSAWLYGVHAKSDNWNDTLAGQGPTVSFLFEGANGLHYDLSMDGDNPQTPLGLMANVSGNPPPTEPHEREQIINAMKHVNLTPSQVIAITWTEGYSIGAADDLGRTLTLTLHPRPVEGIPTSNPVWSIHYEATGTGLTLWVDATTGNTVHRTMN